MENYLAVGIGALLHFFLGALWYSPKLFANAWMDSIGMTEKDIEAGKSKGMAKALIISFICSIFIALSSVHFVELVKAASIGQALYQLLCPILGFVLAPIAIGIEYESRKWSYFFISAGYIVAGIAISATFAILL